MKIQLTAALIVCTLASPGYAQSGRDQWLVLEKPGDNVPSRVLSSVHEAIIGAFSTAELTPVMAAQLLEKVPDIGEREVAPKDMAELAGVAEASRALLVKAERKGGQLIVGLHIFDVSDELLVSVEEKVKPRTAGKSIREILDGLLGNTPVGEGETAAPVALSPSEIDERKVAFGAHIAPLDGKMARSIKEIKNVGVYVQNVSDSGTASEAGLAANDIIVSVDGKLVNSPLDVRAAIAASTRTEPMTFVVWRDNALPSLVVTWGNGTATHKRRKRPKISLGVRVRIVDDAIAEKAGLPFATGAAVVSVKKGSLGEKIGLRADDVIVSVSGTGVDHARNLSKATIRLKKASDARVKVWREGKEVILPQAPDGATPAPEAPSNGGEAKP